MYRHSPEGRIPGLVMGLPPAKCYDMYNLIASQYFPLQHLHYGGACQGLSGGSVPGSNVHHMSLEFGCCFMLII